MTEGTAQMNIEIHQPELARRVREGIQSGRFHDVDELLTKALDALSEKEATDKTLPHPEVGFDNGRVGIETGSGDLTDLDPSAAGAPPTGAPAPASARAAARRRLRRESRPVETAAARPAHSRSQLGTGGGEVSATTSAISRGDL